MALLLASLLVPPPDYKHSVQRSAILLGADSTWLAGTPSVDEQWSFEPIDKIPEKYFSSLIIYEDKRFYSHFGIDAMAVLRALKQNLKERKIISGASTLTMQLARLYKKSPSRSIWNKLVEIHLAIRTEIYYSKQEIVYAYASCAPFGGNIIGVEAASMRYFNRLPTDLSWSEAALLAVLPNSPSAIFPGKKSDTLREKRNFVLKKLYKEGIIDSLTLQLSVVEPIPILWKPIPTEATHALARCKLHYPEANRFYTSIDHILQKSIQSLWNIHAPTLSANGIHNGAVLVLDVETGCVKAYQANFADSYAKVQNAFVDCITSPRSTGSILKPLLFAHVLESGILLPTSLVADVPTMIGGYVPRNHDLSFEGAVPFKNAVYRSLNVPAVRVLHQYGVAKFHQNLQNMGFSTLSRPAVHYGLSIILGGAEGTLWDICGIYASMARSLNHYHRFGGSYFIRDWHSPTFFASDSVTDFYGNGNTHRSPLLSASVLWHTFETMKEVYRPDMETGWKKFPNAQNIAWKTGTSFGNRDGWAVGITPKYVVGIWVGNASGEGRAELTGIKAAAPVLFDVFRLLPQSEWFHMPERDMQKTIICAKSGYKAGECCIARDTLLFTKQASKSPLCSFCKGIFMDKKTGLRVNSECEYPSNMLTKYFFVLPPTMAAYYVPHHPSYVQLPAFRPDCKGSTHHKRHFEIIYPVSGSKVFIPRELEGEKGKMIAKVAVSGQKTTLFWHLDNYYLGSTTEFHHFPLQPPMGNHKLTVMDEYGNYSSIEFEIHQ